MEHGENIDHEILKLLWELREDVKEIKRLISPQLTNIQLAFSLASTTGTGETLMATAGPVILTTAGQVATASVLGFDQFGNAWTGTIPPVTYTSSDTAGAVITSVPNADGLTDTVTAVANGVANLTASLTTAEGLSLTDTESVTVTIGTTTGTPVLSSIKVAFA